MAHRRCLGALARRCRSLLSSTTLEPTRTPPLPSLDLLSVQEPLSQPVASSVFRCINPVGSIHTRNLSSRTTNSSGDEEEEDDEEDGDGEEEVGDDDEYEEEEEEGRSTSSASKCVVQRGKTEEEKAEEAAAIGYQVVAPLHESERPFKPWEPVFAVVQIGSHQFKVSNGDSIFTERLKFCEVNDKLILNKVLMMGSQTQTIIGRPILPDAAVHAVVEEHALDAKVIIFKKKRRKNYRRTKGHRQELTKLRITDIQGIDKVESTAVAA